MKRALATFQNAVFGNQPATMYASDPGKIAARPAPHKECSKRPDTELRNTAKPSTSTAAK